MPPKKGKRKDDFDFDNPEAELASLSMADGPSQEPAASKQSKAKGGEKAEKHVEIEAPSMMDAAVDEDDAPAGGAAKKGKDKKKKNKGKEDFDFDNPPSIEEVAAAAAEAHASKAAATPKAKSGFAALMGDDEEGGEEDDADEEQARLTKEQEKAAAKEKAKQEKEAEKARQEEEKQRQKEAKEREKEAKKAAAAQELAARVIPEHLKAEIPLADLKKAIQKIGFTFKKVIVAKVVSVSPHPKADNMCVATVSNGRNDLVVVCSDTTVQPGQLVPFAPVGSEIEDPETQMSLDITARKLRGIDSYGMLCSEADLKLNEEGAPASSSHVFPVPPYCIIGADFAEQYLLYCNRPKLLKILDDAAAASAAAKEKQAAAAAAKAQAAATKGAAAEALSPCAASPSTPGSAGTEEGNEEDDATGDKKKKKKGKAEEKKPNAIVQRALEAAAAKRLEEERIAAAIQAAKEAEEAEIKRIEEEERAAKEEKDRKKAAKKASKDEATKAGKAVSAKDKEREAANARYVELLKKTGAAPSVLLKPDGAGAAEGEGGAAVAAPKSFSVKDTKKKKRAPKAGSVEDWESEAQSVSLEVALKETATLGDDEPIEVEGDSDDDGSSVDTDDVYDPAWDEDETMDKSKMTVLVRKAKRTERRRRAYDAAQAARTPDNIRSPVVVIMGHVDTGKTKLLDKIRKTNVQEGEAGGITQQIGATFFPKSALQEKTLSLGEKYGLIEVKVPGLLIIDTPGHEAFSNLRSRGSSLCDIAILVVDIVHGLEPQTVESLNMLLAKKTPFVVALNKIDRMYGWQQTPDGPCRASLEAQTPDVISEFNERCKFVIGQFNEKGLNAALYWENPDVNEYISLVPTSAITGEGIPDLLMSLVSWTQQHMLDRIMYSTFLQCTVMEVKTIEGLGTTIDAILVNGRLRRGDTIALCGLDGPIFTQVRALLTPEPMKEMRVKNPYTHHKVLYGAMGVKISAQNMERTIAGSQLLVVGRRDEREDVGDEIAGEVAAIVRKYLNKDGIGVYVQASTLGSLEALLEFLKKSKIPVSAIGIGPVHKLDVVRASIMLERELKYAMILAFDVDVVPDAERLAKEVGVKIFTAKIIYHLFDAFTTHMEAEKQRKKREAMARCVFPVEFTMLQKFNDEPIVMGVQITEGILKIGTPICVPERDFIVLGKVIGIQHDKKPLEEAKKGMTVAVKIEQKRNCQNYVYGRHFDEKCTFVSKMDRESIDLLKENFRDELKKDDWKLVVKLKSLLNIPGP